MKEIILSSKNKLMVSEHLSMDSFDPESMVDPSEEDLPSFGLGGEERKETKINQTKPVVILKFSNPFLSTTLEELEIGGFFYRSVVNSISSFSVTIECLLTLSLKLMDFSLSPTKSKLLESKMVLENSEEVNLFEIYREINLESVSILEVNLNKSLILLNFSSSNSGQEI